MVLISSEEEDGGEVLGLLVVAEDVASEFDSAMPLSGVAHSMPTLQHFTNYPSSAVIKRSYGA